MSLKDELKAIQDKKNAVDRAVFEHIVNVIIADLKYTAELSKSEFITYCVNNFTFSVILHKEDYLPGEKPFIDVSVEHIAELKAYFEKEGVTIDGTWTRLTGNGSITFSWE